MTFKGNVPDDIDEMASSTMRIAPSGQIETGIDGVPKATKHDAGKPRYALLPVHALEEVVKVLTDGAVKYSAGNWKENGGFDYDRPISAAMRHQMDFLKGQRWDTDPKSGHRHVIANAICELLFLLDFDLTGNGNDNRRKLQYLATEIDQPADRRYRTEDPSNNE